MLYTSVTAQSGEQWEQGGVSHRNGQMMHLSVAPLPLTPPQDDEDVSEFALDGLKQVMAIKSRVVLPYLVPKVKFSTWWPHPSPTLLQ